MSQRALYKMLHLEFILDVILIALIAILFYKKLAKTGRNDIEVS